MAKVTSVPVTEGQDPGTPAGAGRRRLGVVLAMVVLVACLAAGGALLVREDDPDTVATATAPPPARTQLLDPPTGPWSAAAADATTGRMLWGIPLTDDFEILSGLVVEDGVLYGQYGSCARDTTRERDAGVVAIATADGTVLWQTPPLLAGETAYDTNVRSARDGVYVAISDGEDLRYGPTVLVAVDTSTGSELWRREVAPAPAGSGQALLDGSVLVVASRHELGGFTLHALDRSTGEVQWDRRFEGSSSVTGLAVVGDRLLVSTARGASLREIASEVASYDLGTGEEQWTAREVRFDHPGFSEDGVLLASPASGDPGTVGLEAETGRERWRRPGWEDHRPLYRYVVERVEGEHAAVEVLNLADGRTTWRAPDGLRVDDVRPHGVLLFDERRPDSTGNGHPITLFTPDGTEIGPVPQLPIERDQMMVSPAIDAAHHVYHGRGCPGRS